MYQFELRPNRRSDFLKTNRAWDKDFENFFDAFSREDYFSPLCEIADNEKSYLIELDIPGLTKEDLDIEIKDNHLHVTGERKRGGQDKCKNVLRNERRYGKFLRVFSLPQNVNSDQIQARFENGVLEIFIPKEEKAQTKKVVITSVDNRSVESDLKN